jgi:hypothetical protein
MIDAQHEEKTFSSIDEDEHYQAVEFDPECTFVDEEVDSDTLAFRDAIRDIWAAEGRVELLLL